MQSMQDRRRVISWYNPASWDVGDIENFANGAMGGLIGGIGNAAIGGRLTGGGKGPGAVTMIQPKPGQYDYAMDQYKNMLGQATPTVAGAQLNPAQMAQSRQGMLDVAGRLGSIANGTQQGAGEMAVNAQLGRATAAQTAAARMARGANAALASRNAMRNTADLGLAGAGQAAQARMQDQQGANAQLGQLFGNMYGQDAGVAAQNAQLAQGASMANQQAQLQQQAQRIQTLGAMLGWDQATINAQIAQANAAIAQQQTNQTEPNFLSNLMKGGGQLATFAAMA